MKHFKFTALIKEGDGGGAYVEVPFDVEKEFGRKRVKIKATFNNEPYRGSLVRMNTACHLLLIRKEIRSKIGKDIGDEIVVTIEEDTDPRVVEIPDDVLQVFSKYKTLRDKFEKLSYTHRKEYITWVVEAKKEQTRKSRIEKMLEMLSAK